MNFNLHIERLMLDGVDLAPGQGQALQAAVEARLAELVAAGGLAAQLAGGVAIPRLAGPPIQLKGRDSARDLGRQIAGAVYGGLGA